MSAADDARRFADPAFWAEVPLTISEAPASPRLAVPEAPGVFLEDLRSEGWAQGEGVLPTDLVERLREGILDLRRMRLPAPFVFLFDEAWTVFHGLDGLWRVAMGEDYRVLPCFWAWYVPVGSSHSGWPVHRDRTRGYRNVLPDGSPMTLSVWVPLTPATPANGCMYVIPAPFGPARSRDIRVGDARALPALPGDVLAWRQDVWHWGGRSSARASTPRIALGLELQGRTTHAFDRPLLAPGVVPPFRHRLALVGSNLWRYRARLKNTRTHALARALMDLAPELDLSCLDRKQPLWKAGAVPPLPPSR